MVQLEYEPISKLIANCKEKKLDKINFYGVVTYISKSSGNCTKITLVDKSCTGSEKLKCNIFSKPEDSEKLLKSCEVGDIFRCHRFMINTFNNHPQGVCNEVISSWISFKRNETCFEFEGNKNSSIDEQDIAIVKELREWLKTKPCLEALKEANLFETPENDLFSNDSLLNMNEIDRMKFKNLKLTKLNKVFPNMYFDVICQVCGICEVKYGMNVTKFLLVWDGTKPDLTIFQEKEFTFEKRYLESTASNIENESKVFYSKSIKEYLVFIYVFDEHTLLLDQIEAGDFVLLKNAYSTDSKNLNADMVVKIPSGGSKFNRTIFKLTSHSGDLTHLKFSNSINDISTTVKFIHEKSTEFKMKFISETQFESEHRPTTQIDTTLLALMQNNQKQTEAHNSHLIQKPTLSEVDLLLKDESDAYSTASEEEKEENSKNSNKGKKSISPKNININKSSCNNSENFLTRKNQTILESFNSPTKVSKPLNEISILNLTTNNPDLISSTLTSIHVSNNNQNVSELNFFNKRNEEIIELNSSVDKDKEKNTSLIRKKKKHYDSYEISNQIFKLKRLVNLTFLAPYVPTDLNYLKTEKSIQFFFSLENLAQHAATKNFTRSKVVAKLFNYALTSCPQISSVFVNCKQCNYINFVPFHLSNIHQLPTLKGIMTDLDNKQSSLNSDDDCNEAIDQNDELAFKLKKNDLEELKLKRIRHGYAKNFSLNWLRSALPIGMQMPSTQQSTQDNQIPIMYYECPRCSLENANKSQDNEEESNVVSLDFIYRFWFILRDLTSRLEPCLIEGDLAEKFLESVQPIKFFTNQLKSHQVYNKIHKSLDKKYLFTIETSKLVSKKIDISNKNGSFLPNQKCRKLDILYKIVEMEIVDSSV